MPYAPLKMLGKKEAEGQGSTDQLFKKLASTVWGEGGNVLSAFISLNALLTAPVVHYARDTLQLINPAPSNQEQTYLKFSISHQSLSLHPLYSRLLPL